MRKEMKEALIAIKADIAYCAGIQNALRIFGRYFETDDSQRMKCELKNHGEMAAWDALMDNLICCGEKAFEHFRKMVHDDKAFSDIRETFEKICESKGLGEVSSDEETSSVCTNTDLPLQESHGRLGGRRSVDSNASWSSFEENNEVSSSRQSSIDESNAKSKRERFGSCGSGKGSTGSRDGAQGQSMIKSVTLDDQIKLLPITAKRKLNETLNHENVIDKDWRSVAERLNMENSLFQNIATQMQKMDSIIEWMRHGGMLIRDLFDIFCEINSKECIMILVESGVHGIPEESYRRQFPKFNRLTSVEESSKENASCLDQARVQNKPVQESEIANNPIKNECFEPSNERIAALEKNVDKQQLARPYQESESTAANHTSEQQKQLNGIKEKWQPEDETASGEQKVGATCVDRGKKKYSKPMVSSIILPIDYTRSKNVKREEMKKSITSDFASCEDGCPAETDKNNDLTKGHLTPSIGNLPGNIFKTAVNQSFDDDALESSLQSDEKHPVMEKPLLEEIASKLAAPQPVSETPVQETAEIGSKKTLDSLEVTGKLVSKDNSSSISNDSGQENYKTDNSVTKKNPFSTSLLSREEQLATNLPIQETTSCVKSNEFGPKGGELKARQKSGLLQKKDAICQNKPDAISWYQQTCLDIFDYIGWGRKPAFPQRALGKESHHKEGSNSYSGHVANIGASENFETLGENVISENEVDLVSEEERNSINNTTN